jgi:hypothetical protein
MARYRAQAITTTAVAVNTAVGLYLMANTNNGFSLKRVTAGLVMVGSTATPVDQNGLLGIAPATAAPTGSITSLTATKMKSWYGANNALVASAWGTTNPTFGAQGLDAHEIPVNARGGYEGVWEPPQEWDVTNGTANGFVFVNRANALNSPLAWSITVEWEE